MKTGIVIFLLVVVAIAVDFIAILLWNWLAAGLLTLPKTKETKEPIEYSRPARLSVRAAYKKGCWDAFDLLESTKSNWQTGERKLNKRHFDRFVRLFYSNIGTLSPGEDIFLPGGDCGEQGK